MTVITRHLTGPDLRSRRMAAGVTQEALSRQLGVVRTAVTNVELLIRPSERAIGRYFDALAALERLADG